MDCKTARLLLNFARPSAGELGTSEAEELDYHLAACSACDVVARAERQADKQFTQAMLAVPIPLGLRERLLRRLEAERAGWYGRWLLRSVAAAAALFVALWMGYGYLTRPAVVKPDFDVARDDSLTPERVEEWFRARGVSVTAPGRFNYSLLAFHGMVDFQGKSTPMLLFTLQAPHGPIQARVYILSDKRFDLSKLPEPEPESGSRSIEVWRPDDPHIAYLIFYNGDTLAPFMAHQREPAA